MSEKKKRLRISVKVWEEILQMLEEGETIRSISAMEGMPSWPTMRLHIRDDPAHATQYARARAVAADAYEAEILDILTKTHSENANASRVQIDALKWIMGKRAPRVYGDKITQELTGANGTPLTPPTLIIQPIDVEPKEE